MIRVHLKPLKKPSRLAAFRASNCVFCGFENNIFTITFRISDDMKEEVMQELVIDFSNVRKSRIYISKPFTYDNVKSEDYGNE